MTTEGLMSLCHALQKIEAVETKAVYGSELPRVRIRVVPRPVSRPRPTITALTVARKPIQSEFDWPAGQLRLFKGGS